MRLSINDFGRGLWLIGGKEKTVDGFLRRTKGMHRLRTPSLRSRNGMTLVQSAANPVLWIIRYDGDLYYITGTAPFSLYNAGSLVYTENKVIEGFIKLPPQQGQVDSLFLAYGGGVKVDTSDATTRWGIAPPSGLPTVADNGVGTLSAGRYEYCVVFKNSVTGSRSNPVLASSGVTLAASRQARLTSIPVSSDAQVDSREIYRTVANGARFFRVAVIADNVTTTYNDNTPDTGLASLELQFDNIDVSDTTLGFLSFPWVTNDRRVWWLPTTGATAGRAYYSPPGRPESVRGFIIVCGTGETLRYGVSWNSMNWIFSEARIYRVVGEDEPFVAVPLDGVPGLVGGTPPCITPYGIAYLAVNGIYLFDGSRAQLIAFDEIGLLFEGDGIEGMNGFLPVTGSLFYAQEQLFLTNKVNQTLIYSFRNQTWRDPGVVLTHVYYDTFNKQLLAAINGGSGVYEYEANSTTTDSGAAIAIEWEVACGLSDIAHFGTVQRVYLDINTNTATLSVSLICDETVIALGTVSTAARQPVEFPGPSTWQTRVFSVRLSGTASTRVELFGIAVDVKLEGSNSEGGVG